MAGGMHGRGGHAWQGANVWQGGMCGRGHVWWGGVCGRGACMAGHMCATPPPPPHLRHYKIRSVNARVVRILLECILVPNLILFSSSSSDYIDCLLASTELTCGPNQAKTGEKEKSIKEQTANIKEKFHFRVRFPSV